MMAIVMLGLAVLLLGATVIGATLPRPTPPPVVYLRAEAPAEAGGDLGFALIIFVVLALVVAMAG